MESATHIANPVSVRAEQITSISEPAEDGSLLVIVGDRPEVVSAAMLARYIPVPGDYIVTQDDGYQYINPREVFERKYSPIGSRVSFAADRECASFLRDVARKVELSGEQNELCAVVYGTYGGMVYVNTINSGLEAIGILQAGQRLMLDVIMPNPTINGEPS